MTPSSPNQIIAAEVGPVNAAIILAALAKEGWFLAKSEDRRDVEIPWRLSGEL